MPKGKAAGPANDGRPYRIFRLESWEEFLQTITSTRYSNWAFRGERDERWPLYSAISRYFRNYCVHCNA